MMNKPQKLRIIMKNGSSLFLYDVVKFSLLHDRDEDLWNVEKAMAIMSLLTQTK